MNFEQFNESVRRLVFGYRKHLSIDDQTTLGLFQLSLNEDHGRVVAAQIEAIIGAKPESKGRLTQLVYQDQARDNLPRVPDRRIDIFAASIVFDNNRADVIFSEGLLVAIEYSPGPFPDARRRGGTVLPLCDLGRSRPEPTDGGQTESVALMLGGVTVSEVRPAVERRFQQNFAARFRCVLPREFLGLIEVADGFETKSSIFYGTQSRTIPWPDKTFLVLAEHRELPVLLCMEDKAGVTEIQLGNVEDESFTALGDSFLDALALLEGYSVS